MTELVRDLPRATIARAYSRWPVIYDLACGPLFRSAHRAAAEAANRIGGHVLEVGVGTGLLLPLYRRDLCVTGIDLSEEMLAKARARLRRQEMPQVMGLELGDIHTLRHLPERYDSIVLPFVLTLLARPEAALDNCRRMLKPGGEIVAVSHFRSATPWIGAAEAWLAPRIASLGLRPDFPLDRVAAWAASFPDLEAPVVAPVGAFGVYKLVRIRKSGLPTSGVIRLSQDGLSGSRQ